MFVNFRSTKYEIHIYKYTDLYSQNFKNFKIIELQEAFKY